MRFWVLTIVLISTLQIFVSGQDAESKCAVFGEKDESSLRSLEQAWAKALEQRDAGTVGCILDPEFQDADVNGEVHDRSEMLLRIPQRKPTPNHLQDMRARVLGDTAYVRGLNQVTDASGKTLAQVRFTDIFVYRRGTWQAIAGQETLVAKTAR